MEELKHNNVFLTNLLKVGISHLLKIQEHLKLLVMKL
jgi:hypothetical protein